MVKFEDLACQVFRQADRRCCPTSRKLYDLLLWMTNDSKYDSDRLEEVVQTTFGTRATLFDGASQAQSQVKMGIMATTVGTSQLRIFTNYNGVGRAGRQTSKPR